MDHWRGPHARLVARTPGYAEYRQHHFTSDGQGLWPELEGVQTRIPDERRIDGVPEVTFSTALGPLLGFRQSQKVQRDEANAFGRTILHLTAPRGGRWHGNAETVGFRTVVLLRARPSVGRVRFGTYVNDLLAPRLAGLDALGETRSMVFLPWCRHLWNSPNVAHDYPAAHRFHGCLILGAASRHDLVTALASPRLARLNAEHRRHLAAAHAYEVADTYVFLRDGRPTLP
ncbi:hypothetical protein ACGFNU_34645 [Spirillospora sp. NPDC048911]|uniref:hypothetical protein n=1 Tax=Spirillospora sp. NPDC048911 TaxID=3364527 RepID=UPI00371E19B4